MDGCLIHTHAPAHTHTHTHTCARGAPTCIYRGTYLGIPIHTHIYIHIYTYIIPVHFCLTLASHLLLSHTRSAMSRPTRCRAIRHVNRPNTETVAISLLT